ncbi:hypothetical protein HBA55_14410 [Pseudomaricurvus alkylphenolicus]|uniref:helix-turn-helix domain-containing protein n=1 Tax=Pseudomaricurvus alkylphenolicus TaxID=1306991 RepID=UPI00142403E5|nr:helix-turn-helix domain-containing protein [Pseudomaricurvus alkylphenolicus]NIB40790.1 hypothetical protein [Pseudomaricurvus alkylphenolicus]
MSNWNDVLTILTPYAIPSALALLIKIVLIISARKSLLSMNHWLLAFLAALFAANLVELMGFAYVDKPEQGLTLLQAYYVAAICACASMLGLSLNIHGVDSPFIDTLLLAVCLACTAAIFIPNAALLGAESIGYAVTRIAGPRYWIIQATMLVTLVGSVGVLFSATLFAKNRIEQKRALVLLVATLPFVIAILITVAAMHYGVKINAAVTVPLAITIILAVLIYAETEQGLFNLVSRIPLTNEHQYLKGMRRLWSPDVTLEQAKLMTEKIMVYQAMQQADGDKTKAAEILGISPATMQRKFISGNNRNSDSNNLV